MCREGTVRGEKHPPCRSHSERKDPGCRDGHALPYLPGGKCLYIVPLKALASEKYEDFARKKVKVGISTGDFDRRDENLGRNDIIVATSEKVDSLIRNRAHWIPAITLLVVDEVHLIDEPRRGPTLEMVITKLRAKTRISS